MWKGAFPMRRGTGSRIAFVIASHYPTLGIFSFLIDAETAFRSQRNHSIRAR